MTAREQIGAPASDAALNLDEHLPAEVLAKIDAVLASRKRLRREMIEKLDAAFSLSTRPGLRGAGVTELLRRRHKELASRPGVASAVALERRAREAADDADDRLRAYRARQVSIAAILDSMFGRFAECDPTLWDRRAYHLLVGLLYERLATGSDEVGTDELVKLAKALSEVRRAMSNAPVAEASTGGADGKDSLEKAEPSGLPPRLARAVRMVYGMAEEAGGDRPGDNGSIEDVEGPGG